ncbi:MAG TPA: F0F1 ATP synthase subunit beta, partial [Firmicutes bacterium]|nr:F0F1 ATP synthase subunit beta [Bacillota bacterium]
MKKIEEALKGIIVRAVGPVIDVKFENRHLPEILTALQVPLSNDKSLTLEVMQHIGDDVVRSVAMGPTDGLKR